MMTASERAAAIRGHLTDAWDLLTEAYRAADWLDLGYDDWGAYLAGEFPVRPQLGRAERPEVFRQMADAGMSQREIGATTGVAQDTVSRSIGDRNRSDDDHDEPDIDSLPTDVRDPEPEPDPLPMDPEAELSGSRYIREAALDRAAQRAARALDGFLRGWPIAGHLRRDPNRDRTLAALPKHDRELFLRIESEQIGPPVSAESDLDQASPEAIARIAAHPKVAVEASRQRNRHRPIVDPAPPEPRATTPNAEVAYLLAGNEADQAISVIADLVRRGAFDGASQDVRDEARANYRRWHQLIDFADAIVAGDSVTDASLAQWLADTP